jgi:hypothetical protein
LLFKEVNVAHNENLKLGSYVFPIQSENFSDSAFGKEYSSSEDDSSSKSLSRFKSFRISSMSNLLNFQRRKSKSSSNLGDATKLIVDHSILDKKSKSNSFNGLISFRSKKPEFKITSRKISLTLLDILQDSKMRSTFKNFTESEYSCENVNFWEDVEKFKKIRDLNERIEEGERIFEMYLTSISEQEINVCAETSKN